MRTSSALLSPRRGQALILFALTMTALLAIAGLGTDAAVAFAAKTRLQRAVDAAALSSVQDLTGSACDAAAQTPKVNQFLRTNDIEPTNTITNPISVTVACPPEQNQVQVTVVQTVPTYFIKLLGLMVGGHPFETIDIYATATADISSYAEISLKPIGQIGRVSELNISVWGVDSKRTNGDAYSPSRIGPNPPSGYSSSDANPEYAKLPFGYLYRVDVPSNYRATYGDVVRVEFFDADTWNRSDYPPQYLNSPCGGYHQPGCINNPCYGTGSNEPNDPYRHNTGLNLDAYGSGWHCFWRVDEYRPPWNSGAADSYNTSYATRTRYSLWHFDSDATNVFVDPSTIGTLIAQNEIGGSDAEGSTYDLKWRRLSSSWDIDLTSWPQEVNGNWFFYVYVKGIAGSSENNFDMRAGPPGSNCDTTSDANCRDINQQATHPWETGGVMIFAKRAMPLNLDGNNSFQLQFTQVPRAAAGQTLLIRHFDNDKGTGTAVTYEMQACNNSWVSVGSGYLSGNNLWNAGSQPDADAVSIPASGTGLYNQIFGGCPTRQTSWLRMLMPSYPQDTSIWEMLYIRPRLLK